MRSVSILIDPPQAKGTLKTKNCCPLCTGMFPVRVLRQSEEWRYCPVSIDPPSISLRGARPVLIL